MPIARTQEQKDRQWDDFRREHRQTPARLAKPDASRGEFGHAIAHVSPFIEAADWQAGDLYDTGSGSITIPTSTYGIYQLRKDANGTLRYLSVGSHSVANPWPFRFNSASFNSGHVFVAKDRNRWFITGAQNLFAQGTWSAVVGGSGGQLNLSLSGYSILTTVSSTRADILFKSSNLWCEVSFSGVGGIDVPASSTARATFALRRNGGDILTGFWVSPVDTSADRTYQCSFSARRLIQLSKDDQITAFLTLTGGTVDDNGGPFASPLPTTGDIIIKPCLDLAI